MVLADESAFYMLTFSDSTYAPKRKTPIIRSKLSNKYLSAISSIARKGRLYTQLRETSFKGVDVVAFLRHLLRHIPGKLLVIRNDSPIHRSKEVKTFLSAGSCERLHLECLPAYSPI
ncbi:MAG: transposase [Desulfovibrio sp.]|nr:transposase [Desulfovibrio sp.]